MKKADMVAALAERTGETQATAAKMLDALPSVLLEALSKDGSVMLPGVAKLERRQRAARKIRNPRTGEMMDRPESVAVGFKAAKPFKDAVASTAPALPASS